MPFNYDILAVMWSVIFAWFLKNGRKKDGTQKTTRPDDNPAATRSVGRNGKAQAIPGVKRGPETARNDGTITLSGTQATDQGIKLRLSPAHQTIGVPSKLPKCIQKAKKGPISEERPTAKKAFVKPVAFVPKETKDRVIPEQPTPAPNKGSTAILGPDVAHSRLSQTPGQSALGDISAKPRTREGARPRPLVPKYQEYIDKAIRYDDNDDIVNPSRQGNQTDETLQGNVNLKLKILDGLPTRRAFCTDDLMLNHDALCDKVDRCFNDDGRVRRKILDDRDAFNLLCAPKRLEIPKQHRDVWTVGFDPNSPQLLCEICWLNEYEDACIGCGRRVCGGELCINHGCRPLLRKAS